MKHPLRPSPGLPSPPKWIVTHHCFPPFSVSISHFLTSASWDHLQSKHLPQPLVPGPAFRKTQTKALFKTTWRLLRDSHDFYDFIMRMEIRAFFCPFILNFYRLSSSSGNREERGYSASLPLDWQQLPLQGQCQSALPNYSTQNEARSDRTLM